MSQNSDHKTFFRQSGWLILCTVLSGLAFFSVHFFNKKIPDSEYSIFVTLLAVLNCLSIPALGLQMVFTKQAAAAVSDSDMKRLTRTTHGVLLGTFIIWLIAVAIVFVYRNSIISGWKLTNPLALWLMLLVGLASLWLPIFTGLLQGRQKFLWVGWAMIMNSIGRVAVIAIIILVIGWYQAAGMTTGILIGILTTLFISAYTSRECWMAGGEPMKWKDWLEQIIPLTFGFGAFQFMFSADPLFVQWLFDEENAYYMMAGTLGRALCTFTVPVVTVMFPKIVRSAALSEKSNIMGLTLMLTGGLVGLGAFALGVVAPVLLVMVGKPDYVNAAPLVRWFALSMVPLAIGNVLLNDLLARNRFRVVPWLLVVVVGYCLALMQFKPGAEFSPSQIVDAPSLAAQLQNPTNSVSVYVSSQLSQDTRRLIADRSADSKELASSLAGDLNKIRSGESLYTQERFKDVHIRHQTQVFLEKPELKNKTAQLNRLLLEDTYPKEIKRPSFTNVIQTLGVFNALFLGIVCFFMWKDSRSVRKQTV